MGYQARDRSDAAQQRRANDDSQLTQRRPRSEPRPGHRQDVGRILVQTEFPVERKHVGKKSVRKLARLWVKP